MNRAIEIHDSVLERITMEDGTAKLRFLPVIIHESAGIPGSDLGKVFTCEALLTVTESAVEGSFSKFPAEVLDGSIALNDVVSENEIPIPLSHEGPVQLILKSWNDETVVITGKSAKMELITQPKYLEDFS